MRWSGKQKVREREREMLREKREEVELVEKVSGQQPGQSLPFSVRFVSMRVNLRVQKQREKQIRDSRLAQLNSLGSSTVANAALTYQHNGDGGLGG